MCFLVMKIQFKVQSYTIVMFIIHKMKSPVHAQAHDCVFHQTNQFSKHCTNTKCPKRWKYSASQSEEPLHYSYQLKRHRMWWWFQYIVNQLLGSGLMYIRCKLLSSFQLQTEARLVINVVNRGSYHMR